MIFSKRDRADQVLQQLQQTPQPSPGAATPELQKLKRELLDPERKVRAEDPGPPVPRTTPERW